MGIFEPLDAAVGSIASILAKPDGTLFLLIYLWID